MPKKSKSSKNRKSKSEGKRKIELKDDECQEYGKVIKAHGHCMFDVECYDGKTRLCKARSRRVRIHLDQYVIVSLRDFDDKRGDIIHAYFPEEAQQLRKMGVLNQEMENKKDDDVDDFMFDFEDI